MTSRGLSAPVDGSRASKVYRNTDGYKESNAHTLLARRRSIDKKLDPLELLTTVVPKPPPGPPPSKDSSFQSGRSRLMCINREMASPNMNKIPLFKECTKIFLDAVSQQLYLQTFEHGTNIIEQNDVGTCMYILHCGEVEVVIGEHKVVVATLGSGTLFGEMAVICKNAGAAKRNATIRAKMTCNCWVIDRPALLNILRRFPIDEKVLSAEADRRLKELQGKGLVPVNDKTRAWAKPPTPSVKTRDEEKRDRNKRVLSKIKCLQAMKAWSKVSEPCDMPSPSESAGSTETGGSYDGDRKESKSSCGSPSGPPSFCLAAALPTFLAARGGGVDPVEANDAFSSRRRRASMGAVATPQRYTPRQAPPSTPRVLSAFAPATLASARHSRDSPPPLPASSPSAFSRYSSDCTSNRKTGFASRSARGGWSHMAGPEIVEMRQSAEDFLAERGDRLNPDGCRRGRSKS